MGDEIKIELPDTEPEKESDGSDLADQVIADDLAALKEEKAERDAADILAATALAQAAHDLATSAHSRIDDHNSTHFVEEVADTIEETVEAEAEAEETEPIVEVEAEPEKEPEKDKEPERKHWFYR